MYRREIYDERLISNGHRHEIPIDRIGGVVCSILKGTMTPKYRDGTTDLIYFVINNLNYYSVFITPTKNRSAKEYDYVLLFFDKSLGCRIHVLRIEAGQEHQNVELFCKLTVVTRQVSEVRNRASYGEAKQMHRAVLNIARSKILYKRFPFTIWGDTVKHSTYLLKGPQRAEICDASRHYRYS